MPVKPLPLNATFTASVTFQPRGGAAPVSRTWTFSTGTGTPVDERPPVPPPAEPKPGGEYGVVPAGETTVTWTTTPSKSTPVPQGGPGAGGGGTLRAVDRLRLAARSVSFVAPFTGRGKVTVRRLVPRKDGTKRAERRVSASVKLTAGKRTRIAVRGKALPKGEYVVSITRAGSSELVARSTVRR